MTQLLDKNKASKKSKESVLTAKKVVINRTAAKSHEKYHHPRHQEQATLQNITKLLVKLNRARTE